MIFFIPKNGNNKYFKNPKPDNWYPNRTESETKIQYPTRTEPEKNSKTRTRTEADFGRPDTSLHKSKTSRKWSRIQGFLIKIHDWETKLHFWKDLEEVLRYATFGTI